MYFLASFTFPLLIPYALSLPQVAFPAVPARPSSTTISDTDTTPADSEAVTKIDDVGFDADFTTGFAATNGANFPMVFYNAAPRSCPNFVFANHISLDLSGPQNATWDQVRSDYTSYPGKVSTTRPARDRAIALLEHQEDQANNILQRLSYGSNVYDSKQFTQRLEVQLSEYIDGTVLYSYLGATAVQLSTKRNATTVLVPGGTQKDPNRVVGDRNMAAALAYYVIVASVAMLQRYHDDSQEIDLTDIAIAEPVALAFDVMVRRAAELTGDIPATAQTP